MRNAVAVLTLPTTLNRETSDKDGQRIEKNETYGGRRVVAEIDHLNQNTDSAAFN